MELIKLASELGLDLTNINPNDVRTEIESFLKTKHYIDITIKNRSDSFSFNIVQRNFDVIDIPWFDSDDEAFEYALIYVKSLLGLNRRYYDDKPQSDSDEISIHKIRKAIANYMYSEGCSCCRNSNHDENGEKLATLLRVSKYEDGSGFDWFCNKENGKKIKGYVKWHEESKIQIPDWCPIKTD